MWSWKTEIETAFGHAFVSFLVTILLSGVIYSSYFSRWIYCAYVPFFGLYLLEVYTANKKHVTNATYFVILRIDTKMCVIFGTINSRGFRVPIEDTNAMFLYLEVFTCSLIAVYEVVLCLMSYVFFEPRI